MKFISVLKEGCFSVCCLFVPDLFVLVFFLFFGGLHCEVIVVHSWFVAIYHQSERH